MATCTITPRGMLGQYEKSYILNLHLIFYFIPILNHETLSHRLLSPDPVLLLDLQRSSFNFGTVPIRPLGERLDRPVKAQLWLCESHGMGPEWILSTRSIYTEPITGDRSRASPNT